MYFRHTVSCMTSDDILRYVGAFYKGAKHLGVGVGHLPPQINRYFKFFFQCEFGGPVYGVPLKF
jgi:hypothetical protein